MKGSSMHAPRSRTVLVVMGVLALCSIGLTWATAGNYLAASTAAARFHIAVSGVTCTRENSEYTIGVGISLENQSEWDLSVTSMRSIVYLDEKYVWGRNYDWMGDPFELPKGSARDMVLEIEVPYTKTGVVAGGGDAWSIRVSGLLDMPRLGSKMFVTKAQIPLERGND